MTGRCFAISSIFVCVHVLAQDSGPGVAPITNSTASLYGVTVYGGAYDFGEIYKIDQTGNETVLYSFTGGADGGYPVGGLTGDSAGNLYGTTQRGGSGSHGNGTVFKLDPSGKETVLHSFTLLDGSSPDSGVLRDSAGNFYGAAAGGGTHGWGVVYVLDAEGNDKFVYSFTGGPDGGTPLSNLIRDAAGNLYGTTYCGGLIEAGSCGSGVVFKFSPAGHETILHTFKNGADGSGPSAGLIRDSAGNLYGTTYYGGLYNAGVVFKVDQTGSESVLYSFTGGADGGNPGAPVVRDSAGNLYGTTTGPGSRGGVLYKLDANGIQTVLHAFGAGTDGAYPTAGVARDSAGNLFGTTYFGGANDSGVVYKVDLSGHYTVLHSFGGVGDGALPNAGVILR